MQQRGSNSIKEADDGDQTNLAPSTRGRLTSKLKVLGRSHAMREEPSPPREPVEGGGSPPCHQFQSPCIKLIPSPEPPPPTNGKPLVVLSPSPTGESEGDINPPSRESGCGSPASTLVATPNSRCSPLCTSHANERLHSTEGDLPPSPKYLNNKNAAPSDKYQDRSSHSSFKKKYCDCQNQNCIKCVKEKSVTNNNNHSNINNNVIGSPNMLYVLKNNPRGKLRQQSSSQGSFESATNSPCLSRDSSSEQYTDTTGVDLEQFIPETLNRNAKDRALMLRIEQELVSLAKDRSKTHYKFPPMSSYQRMLVHRCAAYFGMDHNIEPSGKCVVVNKTKNTRIPEVEFKEHIKDDIVFTEEPRRSILKRDSSSIEDYCFKSPERGYSMESRRSKSFEEREEEYEKARRRIFNRELHEGSSEEFTWSSELPWSSTESEFVSKYRLQPPEIQAKHLRRLLKVHSEDAAETMRPCVAKSYSFGGYGGNMSVLTRGDSIMSTHSAGPRLLTKQDSGASSVSWRLSPSSSGYKSQSQMSESITPSPTSTPHPVTDLRQDSNSSGEGHRISSERPENHIVWAVTDIHSVPKGSIIINPETGKPFKNDDGTIYHYDPNRPPPGFLIQPPPPHPQPIKIDASSSPTRSPQKEKMMSPSSPKLLQQRLLSKSSPAKRSNVTTTATSPSLPFSPPLPTSAVMQINKTYPYLQVLNSCENLSNLPQQQFPSYSAAPAESNVQVYQQPYIVYTAPYGVAVQQQYEGRLDQTSIQDLPNTYYLPEGAGPTPSQAITYQPQPPGPFWNQQPVSFYPNSPQPSNPTPPQRFSVPLQSQGQTAYMPTGFPVSYMTQTSAPQPQNTELMSVYHNQPVQMVYSSPPSAPNAAVIYHNQPPVIYAHNSPLYSSAAYPQNVPHYPQTTPTPNSCASIPNPQFGTGPAPTDLSQSYMQLVQNMHQMNLGPSQPSTPRNFMAVNVKCPQQFDTRPRCSIPKSGSGKFIPGQQQPAPRGAFLMGSGQSSTGTNSPAATVIAASYCPQGAAVPGPPYRTPPGTPPTPQFMFQPNFNVAPRLFRQMSGGRETTPGTAKSSRSPTPANDIPHLDRQRMSLPPNLYQGMPYIVQSDPRFVGRGQPNVYRQTPPTLNLSRQSSINQGPDNRSQNKGRKAKGNKSGGLPPSGK